MPEKLASLAMSKRSIGRLFAVAVALVVAGATVAAVVVIAAVANGAITVGGSPFVVIDPGQLAGAVVGLVAASLLTATGTIAAIVAWAAALLNTSRLADKTWFVALLALGLVSLGWIAMFAYVLRGPDGTEVSTSGASASA